MDNDEPTPELIAQHDGARRAVVKTLYSFGVPGDEIVELLCEMGVIPEETENDLAHLSATVPPPEKHFPHCLKALASITINRKFAKLKPEELVLLKTLLEMIVNVEWCIVFTCGGVARDLSKMDLLESKPVAIELSYEDVFDGIFRLVLDRSLGFDKIPDDPSTLQFVLINQVDVLTELVLRRNNLVPANKPASGPLGSRGPSGTDVD